MRRIIISVLTILIIIFASILFLTSSPSTNKFARHLKGKKINIQDTLGAPQDIFFVNNSLIIADNRSLKDDGFIRVYKPNDGKLLSVFGKYGRGPGEFEHIKCINVHSSSSNLLVITDFLLCRLTVFDIANINIPQVKSIYYYKEGAIYNSVMSNDSTILSLGMQLPSGRYLSEDTLGNNKKYMGKILPGKSPQIPFPVHSMAMKGRMKLSDDGLKIIISTELSDIIDIYDTRGSLYSRIKGSNNIIPKYKIGKIKNEPVMFYDENNSVFGYIDFALTPDKILALYSGQKIEDEFGGNVVHVYNFKGNLLEIIRLDHKVGRVTFDSKSKKLYGIQYSPFPEIYSFQL